MNKTGPEKQEGADTVAESGGTVYIRPVWNGDFPWLRSAVSTRQRGVSPGGFGMNTSFRVGDTPENVRANRKLFFGAAGIDGGKLATAGQVHGAVVALAETSGHYQGCDALITSVRGLCLGISVADCLPILLLDPDHRSVGIVHSGWKGSGGKVVLRTLEMMSEAFGTRPGDVRAYIGPSAGGCCYEVGEEVAAIFPEDVLTVGGGGRLRLDLSAFNRSVLLRTGVPEAQIAVSGHCTIHEPEIFHSYRRDRSGSGRMLAVVGIGK